MAAVIAAAAFAVLGGVAERVASRWPPDEASLRGPGARTLLVGALAGASAGAIVWRSALPAWATGAYLLLLAPMVVLTATDLDQRRLPHLLLDPLIVGALVFVPINPAVKPLDAIIGAACAVGFLGIVGLVVRGGVAVGDLYLAGPIGLMLGWPQVFTGLFVAALLSALAGLLLLVTGRAGLRSYMPFGPFLVAGLVVTLVRDADLLGGLARALLA